MERGKRTPAPSARRHRLFVQEVGDELVVFDQETRKAHRLNPTASFVWRACDGRTGVADIARTMRPKFGPAADANLVRVALGLLDAARLLEDESRHARNEIVERRRAFLQKSAAAGAVSLMMPVVATLSRPSLAATLSPVGPQGSSAPGVIALNDYYRDVEHLPRRATSIATFGGGCFWCIEPAYDRLAGVVTTTAGYMGGTIRNPTHDQVVAGTSGHAEVVQVAFDPFRISYEGLLEIFWRNIDPTQRDGQFCDIGPQYRTAIFYHDEDQKHLALASLAELRKAKHFRGEIVTEVVAAGRFYPATEDHQDYYRKQPARYKAYIEGCGRAARLQALWGRRTS
jgi:peptide-methionine (S)-S-oxide reductase